MQFDLLFFVTLCSHKHKNVKMISPLVLLLLILSPTIGTVYYSLAAYALPSRGSFADSPSPRTPNPQINMQANGPAQNKFSPPNINNNNNPTQANVIRPNINNNNNPTQANVIRPNINCPSIDNANAPRSATVGRNNNNCNNINGQVIVNSGSSSSSSSLTINNPTGSSYSNNAGTPAQLTTQYAIPMIVSYPPVASAGANQIVHSNDYVVLDGSGSYDPQGGPLYYSWTQSSGEGPITLLSSYYQPKATFVAPQVTEITTLTFGLIVNNGRDNSYASYTTVTIYP
jgi:K319-like protein